MQKPTTSTEPYYLINQVKECENGQVAVRSTQLSISEQVLLHAHTINGFCNDDPRSAIEIPISYGGLGGQRLQATKPASDINETPC